MTASDVTRPVPVFPAVVQSWEIDIPLDIWRGKVPLTANQRLHWRVRAHRTKWVRQAVYAAAHDAAIPVCQHLTVGLHYRPGDNRLRDADNLVPTLKVACDALARGKRRDWVGLELVPDDTPQYMTKLMPVIHPGPGVRRLWLEVICG